MYATPFEYKMTLRIGKVDVDVVAILVNGIAVARMPRLCFLWFICPTAENAHTNTVRKSIVLLMLI